MNLCTKCFSEINPDAEFCPECGASVSEDRAAEGSDAIVYPALARANLFRMRGDYAKAEEACLSVLKRFPHNETAHILLGDIHADQGHDADALQWYELALDLAPDNPSLRAKIDRAKAAIARQASAKADLEVQPVGRAPVVMFSGVAILLGAVAVIAFVLGKERARAADEARLDSYTRPIYVGDRTPPPPSNAPEQAQPQPLEKTPAQAPASEPPETPSSTTSGSPALAPAQMTPQEQAVLEAVSTALANRASRPLACEFDPRNGSLRLCLLGDAPADDLVSVALAANAALSYGQDVSRVHARVLDPVSHQLRLIATVTRESLQKASGSPGSLEWARSILTDVYPPQG